MIIEIPIDIYSFSVSLVTDRAQLIDKELSVKSDFSCLLNESGKILILCSNLWGSFLDHRFIQCLSHECNHAAMIILSETGVEFGADNQEVLCYLQDYILRTALDKLSGN